MSIANPILHSIYLLAYLAKIQAYQRRVLKYTPISKHNSFIPNTQPTSYGNTDKDLTREGTGSE